MRRPCAALVLLPMLLRAALAVAAEPVREWRFQVLLDGSPIGSQVFRVSRDGDESRVSIEASFDVKLLFFTAYSYRHSNEEVWKGGCLRSMRSNTDDNGKLFHVNAAPADDGFVVETGNGREKLPACVDSFAYWDPDALKATHLLNSQTGEYQQVRLLELGEDTVTCRGAPTPARHVALEGDKLRIDLWYSAGSDWLALESKTTSGRILHYTRE